MAHGTKSQSSISSRQNMFMIGGLCASRAFKSILTEGVRYASVASVRPVSDAFLTWFLTIALPAATPAGAIFYFEGFISEASGVLIGNFLMPDRVNLHSV